MKLYPVVGIILSPLLFSASPSFGGGFAAWNTDTLTLDNGIIHRVISLRQGSVSTSALNLTGDKRGFVYPGSPEFRFTVNGAPVDGKSGWKVISCGPAKDSRQGEGAMVTLGSETGKIPEIELELTWLLYPDLPVVRKKLSIRNPGKNRPQGRSGGG